MRRQTFATVSRYRKNPRESLALQAAHAPEFVVYCTQFATTLGTTLHELFVVLRYSGCDALFANLQAAHAAVAGAYCTQ